MMNEKEGVKRSQLFTLRVWMEEVENGRFELRGQIKHVLTGETTYFREMSALQAILQQWCLTDDTATKPPDFQ